MRVRVCVCTVSTVRLTQAAVAGNARSQVMFPDHSNLPAAAAPQVEDLLGLNHRRLHINDQFVDFYQAVTERGSDTSPSVPNFKATRETRVTS